MLIGAGAEEIFTGLVPADWLDRFSGAVWTNRRGPGGGNLRDFDELARVVDTAHLRDVPVALTLNAPHHAGEQLQAVLEVAGTAREIGVDALIVADPGLVMPLARMDPAIELRLSSVAAVHNHLERLFEDWRVRVRAA